MSTRVLVVDDTSMFRRVISDALAGLPEVVVVGTASNGKLALARLAALQPDLLTLDVEMPEMNGIEMLEALRSSGNKPAVIMVSACTVRGGKMTMRALEAGAFDFITKPEGGTPESNVIRIRENLAPIVQTLARQREIRTILNGSAPKPSPVPVSDPTLTTAPRVPRAPKISGPPIVLIGVSTGGPAALNELVPALPPMLAAPVFIVQHMPPHFTEALAERLQGRSAVPVSEAKDGEIAQSGRVYLAPGGRHMRLIPGPKGELIVRITDDPPENACRPSVDYLFRSVALNFPGRSIAAVLTGMGNDGAAGIRLLKRGGSLTIAQDEPSCVVFGMPREAILTGAIDTVLPLSQIAGAIQRAVAEARP